MRNILFAIPLSLGLLLGGCTSTGTIDLAAFIAQVQQAVTTACGAARIIIPTAKTIADLLAGDNPAVKTVEGMVDLIVATVCPDTPQGRLRAPRAPKAPSGVKIETIQIPGQ